MSDPSVPSPPEVLEIVPGDHEGEYLVRLGGRDQSHVDLTDPTRLAFDYVRRMADVIDEHGAPGEPLRVVHVGGAGLTLPRYVAATRPRSPQVVLEPDARGTALVRERLPLPRASGIRVRAVDGRTGLGQLRASYADVVVLDAYAHGRVPEDLVTVGCFEVIREVLVPDGVLLLNLSDRAPFEHSRRVVAGLRAVLDHVVLSAEPATLRARRAGNLLVVAGRAGVPLEGLRRRATRSPLPYRVLDPDQVGSSFGGGRPLVDPAGEA